MVGGAVILGFVLALVLLLAGNCAPADPCSTGPKTATCQPVTTWTVTP